MVLGRGSLHIIDMKIVLFLLLALPLFGKQSERYYQEKFAREIGVQVEVVMKDGTHAIEVDFAKKWAEAIGQSLNYALHTDILLGLSSHQYRHLQGNNGKSA